MNNFEVCYSEKMSALYIVNRNRNVAYETESNYGVKVGYTVFGEPISFIIPEPENLFGVATSDFKKINSNINN